MPHLSLGSGRRGITTKETQHSVKPGGHIIISTFGPEGPPQNAMGSTLFAMTPNYCTTSLAPASVWWRAPKNCTKHHLALPSSFCIATARSNKQSHQFAPNLI
jgi:hypothetical protein